MRGLQIDDEFEPGWLFDRDVSWLDASQNLHDLPTDQIAIDLDNARTARDRCLIEHAGATQIKPMTGPLRFVIFVAALAVLLAIVMATDGHPLAVIAAVLVAIFLTGRLTR